MSSNRLFVLTAAGVSAESGLGPFRDRGWIWSPSGLIATPAVLESRLRDRGGGLSPCTQNIDDLHVRARSRAVVHMQGEILTVRGLICDAVVRWHDDPFADTPCPNCRRTGGMRPGIVWFGGRPKHRDPIDAALRAADLFVAIGTSGAVYPAAGSVAQARALGIPTFERNLEPSDNAHQFDAGRYGPAGVMVPAFFAAL